MVSEPEPPLVRFPLPLIAPLILLLAELLMVRVPEERTRLPGEVRELIWSLTPTL